MSRGLGVRATPDTGTLAGGGPQTQELVMSTCNLVYSLTQHVTRWILGDIAI